MKLYLDEMISPRVADGLRQRGHDVVATVERDALGASDIRQLALAIREERALVTYNIADFVTIARASARLGRDHAGIVLVSDRRFPPSDVGGLVRALDELLQRHPGGGALRNQTTFLRRTNSG